ncbi:radical SAM protein [uncultured Neglectibacter sp.]|uniref:radical SAM protein n=1 Tax=uncultured Neglectibacter sp. TaxID=1924108 RepID=UPI0034DE649F
MKLNHGCSVCKPPDQLEPLQEITLFTTALCNLKCTYCYICKDNSNALKKIDEDIRQDWEAHNYVSRLRTEMRQEDLDSIRNISLWGGEPLIGIRRFSGQFEEFYKLLPALERIDFSTNLTLPNAVPLIQELADTIGAVSKKEKFYIDVQISIDGPEEINDPNRGEGTTGKILENYQKLLRVKLPRNVGIRVTTKPTLSVDTMDWFLEESNVRSYFAFFDESFRLPFTEADPAIESVFLGIPNYAEPYGYTQADGRKFAEVCRVFQKVSHDHDFPAFRGRSLVPYVDRYSMGGQQANFREFYCGGGCGKLVYSATLTPHGRYSVCHRTLFDSYVEYHNSARTEKLSAKQDYVDDGCNFGLEDFRRHRKSMNLIYFNPSKLIYSDAKTMIKLAANSGVIASKYGNEEQAAEVMDFMCRPGMCLASNMELCHSLFVQPYWWIRLFLNGAMDTMLEELKEYEHE